MDVFQYVKTRSTAPSANSPTVHLSSPSSNPPASLRWQEAASRLNIDDLISSIGGRLGQRQNAAVSLPSVAQKPASVDLSVIEKKVERYSQVQKLIRDLADRRRAEELQRTPLLHSSLSLPHVISVNFADSRVEFIFRSVKNDIPAAIPRTTRLRRLSVRTSHRVTTEIVEEDEDETSTKYFQIRESPTQFSVVETMSEFDDAVKMLLSRSFTDRQDWFSSKKPQSPIPEEDSHFASSDEEVLEDVECLAPRRRSERNRHFPLAKREEEWPDASIEPLGLRLYRPECAPNSKEVPAGDTAPHFGPIMKYAFLRKKRGEHRKFHKRFVVLRGFRLYWYRKSSATWAKGVITVPKEPIIRVKVNHENCFGVSKGNNKYFVVAEDISAINWDVTLSNQIAYRNLLEDLGMYHDFHGVVSYFQNIHSAELSIRDRSLPTPVLCYMSMALPAHTKLQIVSLVNCQLTDASLSPFLSSILGTVRLEALNLSLNSLTKLSAVRISDIIKQEESQWNRLIHLNLSGNPIKDEGLDVLARAFQVRFEEMYWPKALFQLPFYTLEVSSCAIGDAGVGSLCEMLRKTYECIATEADIEPSMKVDLSRNQCSTAGIRNITELMEVYQPISSMNLAHLGDVTGQDVAAFLEVMVQNFSVLSLDLSGLPLSLPGLSALVELLNYNYVLSDIKVTLDEDTMAVAGAHYKEVKSLFTIRPESH